MVFFLATLIGGAIVGAALGGRHKKTKKTIKKIVTETLDRVIVEANQNCKQSSSAGMDIFLTDLVAGRNIKISNIEQNMKLDINFECLADNNNFITEHKTLKKDLEENIEKETGSSIFNKETITEETQNIKNNVLNETISKTTQNCVQTSLSTQSIVVDNLKAGRDINIDNITQSLVANVVGSCLQSNKGTVKAINDLQTLVNNNEAAGGDGGDNNLIVTAAIIVAILILIFLCSSSAVGLTSA